MQLSLYIALSAFLAAATYHLAESGIFLAAYLAAVIACEAIRAAARKDVAYPQALFTAGWTLPLLVAQVPVNELVRFLPPVSATANKASLVCIGLFYIAAVFMRRTRPGCDLSGYSIPMPLILAIMGISNAGYFLALSAHGFQFPVFSENVTEAANDFFSAKGSATLFMLGDVGLMLSAIKLLKHNNAAGHRVNALVLIPLCALFIVEKFMYGKRMGIMLSLFSVFILITSLTGARITVMKVASVVTVASIIFFGNAYLRARYAFYKYYESTGLTKELRLADFVALQGVLYVQPNFANLGELIERSGDLNPGSHTLGPMVRIVSEKDDSVYARIRDNPFNMMTFLGEFIADYGTGLGIFAAFILFNLILLLYNLSGGSASWLALYSLAGPRLVLLFTGNLFIDPMFVTNSLILLAVMTLFRLDVYRTIVSVR